MACSPLMSPAKRTGSTLGPLGFIYPFLFLAPQRVDWGVKFVRCLSCDRLTTSHTHTHIHTHTHSLSHSQRTSCCILPIHVVGFHILLAPLKRYVQETISGRGKPASVQPKGFPKETFTRECSLTSTRVIEAERKALLIES